MLVPDALRSAAVWGGLALGPNLVWEMLQMPLYTNWTTSSRAGIAYGVAHCTVGDGLIAAATFLVTAWMVGTSRWPRAVPVRGLMAATVLGIAYTVWSEYRNVYVAGHWGYASAMPQMFGIGATPLLQWLLLPVVTLWLQRKFYR